MSDRLDSIRFSSAPPTPADMAYVFRRFDRERDVTERMTGAWIVSRSFAEDESRREKPDLWLDDDCDGKTTQPCVEGQPAPATPDPCDGISAHAWSGWRKGDEYSLPPLAVMLPPPPPCPTCGGQMGYVAMTVPGRPRCFRCEPEPSQWREGPPPEEFGWVWFPDDGVWPAQGLPGDTITTTRDDGILRWQHDWRWMPLETPAPPEVTP